MPVRDVDDSESGSFRVKGYELPVIVGPWRRATEVAGEPGVLGADDMAVLDRSQSSLSQVAWSIHAWERLRARGLTPELVLLALLTALATVLRFWGITQSYWSDEVVTVSHLHHSLWAMLGQLPHTETTPPLYFVVAWFWAHVFGHSELGLRSLSAIAGVLTVPVAYAVGAKIFSRRVGVIVAAFATCNPFLVWYSQEARSYALLVLLTSVSLLAFAHLRLRVTRPGAIVWGVAAGLALVTHYYASLAIVPEALLLLKRHRFNRTVGIGVIFVAACGAATIPLALRQLRFVAGQNWININPLGDRVAAVFKEFMLGYSATSYGVAGAAVALWLAVWLYMFRAESDERRQSLVVLSVAAGGCALLAGLIVLGYDQLNTRNAIALWLPFTVLIASGLGIRRAGIIGAAGVILVCGAGAEIVVSATTEWQLQRPNWRLVADKLEAHSHFNPRVIFLVNGCSKEPLAMYMPRLQAASRGALASEIDFVSLGNDGGWYVSCLPQHAVPLPARMGDFNAPRPMVAIHQFSIRRLIASRPQIVSQHLFSAAGLRGLLVVQTARPVAQRSTR
jgi:mannosyltransferase